MFGDTSNTQQIYAVQAGPSYATRVGDVGVSADYRFGWTKTGSGSDLDIDTYVVEIPDWALR